MILNTVLEVLTKSKLWCERKARKRAVAESEEENDYRTSKVLLLHCSKLTGHGSYADEKLISSLSVLCPSRAGNGVGLQTIGY